MKHAHAVHGRGSEQEAHVPGKTAREAAVIRNWRWPACGVSLLASVLLFVTIDASGEPGDPVGMVTQLILADGAVEMTSKGGTQWKPAQSLSALRPGDTVRVTANDSAIVVLSGEGRAVKIDSTNSPFLVPPVRPGIARSEKVVVMLRAAIDYLSLNTRETLAPVLVTRQGPIPPGVLSPRDGPVLPGPLVFEWFTGRSTSVTVTVTNSAGIVLNQAGVTATALGYPPTAPRLVAGERYRLRVLQDRHPPLEAWFEIVGNERAEAIRRDLADLEQEIQADAAPASSIAIMKAGYLAERGLLHDARAILLASLARDAREPALHLLLGHVYMSTGLPDLASRSYRTAQLLVAHDESPASLR